MRLVLLVLVSAGFVALGLRTFPRPGRRPPSLPPEPTANYERRTIEGWTVLINGRFLTSQPGLSGRALSLLEARLARIAERIPAGPLAKLRTVTIWVEETSRNPGMTYHPNADWLKSHGLNPDKARSVELADARNFLKWADDQPEMVLHELAHAYHHQFLPGGFRNPEIRAAYEHATRAGLYEMVRRADGREARAYAARDAKEYFAESTESFFGRNDQFPIDRADLRRHDPGMAELLEKLWEVPDE